MPYIPLMNPIFGFHLSETEEVLALDGMRVWRMLVCGFAHSHVVVCVTLCVRFFVNVILMHMHACMFIDTNARMFDFSRIFFYVRVCVY